MLVAVYWLALAADVIATVAGPGSADVAVNAGVDIIMIVPTQFNPGTNNYLRGRERPGRGEGAARPADPVARRRRRGMTGCHPLARTRRAGPAGGGYPWLGMLAAG